MKKPSHFFPILLAALLLALSVAFGALLLRTKMLPGGLLATAFAAVALADALLIFLCARPKKKFRFALGVLLTVLFALGLCFASAALGKTVSAISGITRTSTEYSRLCVYVRAEDEAESIYDVADQSFGVLKTFQRENTDAAVSQLSAELGRELRIREYDGLTELLDALFAGELRAVILNAELLELTAEVSGYEDITERVKILSEQRAEIEKPQETPVPAQTAVPEKQKSENCFSLYISGIDTRGDISMKSRSDVNIIVTVNTQTHQILLLSTPRDYYVPLPISEGVPDKLTHAGLYGVEVSKGALEMLYDTEIDYYFRVNFTGFQKIIDAIGGVDAELDGYSGVMHLNGEEALKHARDRSYGDRWRGKNQMRIIQAAINKILSPRILSSFDDLLDATEGSFETSMPYDLIASLIREQLKSNPRWEILRYSVDGTGDSAVPFTFMMLDGKPMWLYVMHPDETTVGIAKDLMNAMWEDRVITIPEDYH